MILDLFLIGLVVTLEPIPLTAMILLLAAERGLMKGLGFTLGWLLTLVGIVALTVLVTGGKPLIPQSAPSTGALAAKLAIGVALLFVAYRRNRRPSSSAPKKQPRWMSGIDRINPIAAAGLGFLLQPWVLVAAGVATITQADLSNGRGVLRRLRLLSLVHGELSRTGDLCRTAARSRQIQSQRATRMDQLAHGPGDRVPVARARALSHGEEHLWPGQRRLGMVGPRAEVSRPGGLATVGSSGAPFFGSNAVTSIDP